MAIDTAYTIEDFITAGDNIPISYAKFSLIEKNKNMDHIPVYNIINDYLDELKMIAVTAEFSDEELLHYMYKPKLLCADINGGESEELYFIILAINNMCSIKEFTNKKIKMIKRKDISEILTYIYNAQKEYININRYKLENNKV